MSVAISIIAIPMLLCVYSFYQWLYARLVSVRLSQPKALYQGNRLFWLAEMTNHGRTDGNLSAIFCCCLIFAASAFLTGTFLLNRELSIFQQKEQLWMGYLQIGICIIFLVVYFFLLSFMQIKEGKKRARNLWLLFYMGKNYSELKKLLCTQILVELFLPTMMCWILLWTAVPMINDKMNAMFHVAAYHLLLKNMGGFMLCFFLLYLIYFCVIYIIFVLALHAPLRRQRFPH